MFVFLQIMSYFSLFYTLEFCLMYSSQEEGKRLLALSTCQLLKFTVKPTREEQEQGDLNHATRLSVLPLKCASWVARYIPKACLVSSTNLRNLKNAKKSKRP
ncbi:hypothetical protein AB4K20DRAFT_1864314 [Rhizopus microsporus]